jgi:hypothetical protein
VGNHGTGSLPGQCAGGAGRILGENAPMSLPGMTRYEPAFRHDVIEHHHPVRSCSSLGQQWHYGRLLAHQGQDQGGSDKRCAG